MLNQVLNGDWSLGTARKISQRQRGSRAASGVEDDYVSISDFAYAHDLVLDVCGGGPQMERRLANSRGLSPVSDWFV